MYISTMRDPTQEEPEEFIYALSGPFSYKSFWEKTLREPVLKVVVVVVILLKSCAQSLLCVPTF